MNVQQRLDYRWQLHEEDLCKLAARSEGRLHIVSATCTKVEVELACISAFRNEDASEPEVRHDNHRILLLRPRDWPALPVRAYHLSPPGIFHPNIVTTTADMPVLQERITVLQQLLGLFQPGAICYGHSWPGMGLTDLVVQIDNMLLYRFGAFSQAGEHLNIDAIRWVQEMLAHDPSFFPLEHRPLVAIGRTGDGPI